MTGVQTCALPILSVITAEARERKLFAGEDDINPIGFTVTQYKMRVVHD